MKARIKLRAGQPWSLRDHEYLRAIAEDRSQVIVIEKAAQMGVSTLLLSELLHLCLQGEHAGYFLDTSGHMRRLVQGRLDPIINADDELTRQVVEARFEGGQQFRRRGGRAADNVALKHIGRGTAYFLATRVMADVKTVDLDAIYMDEVAELDEAKSEFAADRLLHSNLKLQRWVSQPDIPGMDIDDWFQRSDQKYWKMRCPKCRRWIALELAWPDCLYEVRGEWRIGCPKCHIALKRSGGQWVATHPKRSISGYHLSQLYGPRITPAEIAEQWKRAQTRPSRLRRFNISILGQPSAGERQPITDELLEQRCGTWGISPDGKGDLPRGVPFAGIDQGDLIHLAIGRLDTEGKVRIVWLEETPEWGLVERRLKEYGAFFICDAMPYKTEAKRLCRNLKSGAILYSSAKRTIYGIEDGETAPVHTINVDRSEYMDRVVDALRAGDLFLPAPHLDQTARAREHLKRFVRDKGDDGSLSYRRGVENHYGMAIASLLLGIESQGALHLAPAGHFETAGAGQRSTHLVGPSHIPKAW